jgi:uncharacterized membrane protein
MRIENRLDELEGRLEEMGMRVRRLEMDAATEQSPLAPRQESAPPQPAPRPTQREPEPLDWEAQWPRREAASAASFEELFGGRVLAWIGGLAILAAAVLFAAMAVSRGWLGEEARTVIATVASLALFSAGVWLHEKKGRTEAAQAAVASAISGLFATLVVATQAYDLIPAVPGLLLGALVAAAGFWVAVRWSAPIAAAVGSVGALASPVLVGTATGNTSIAFVAIALTATAAILVWQRWGWLALSAFVVSAPQVMIWALGGEGSPWTLAAGDGHAGIVLAVLVGFWALYCAAAFGYELRTRDEDTLPIASWLVLLGSCAMVTICGYDVLDAAAGHSAAVVWVFAVAATHLLLGGLATHLRFHREIGSLLIGAGIALAAFGLADALDGPVLVAAWAAAGAALAWLATRADNTPDPGLSDAERLFTAAVGFLTLAIGHTLLFEAPPSALFEGVEDLGNAAAAIAASALAALACYRCGRRVQPELAPAAGFATAALLVYLGSVLIVEQIGVDAVGEARQAGQAWLSAFWTATGLAAVVWGLVRRSAPVRLGGLALLGIAIAKVWTYDLSELDELARVLSFVGLGLLLLAGSFAYQRIKPGEEADEQSPQASV